VLRIKLQAINSAEGLSRAMAIAKRVARVSADSLYATLRPLCGFARMAAHSDVRSFAYATHHRFERMRLRGLTGARDEFHLVAIVQNLKTLANHIWRPPPNEPAACSI